ncbi:MAG: penicillin-binding protein 1C [Candidatus Aminicenantes bacterium]|nr:penicillin-binding protein 1C [Candidatus Aminicenantes bacterium]
MKLSKRQRVVLFAGLGAVFLLCLSFYLPLSRRRFDPKPVISIRLEDRKGVLLREVLSDEGGRCRWVGLKDISPDLLSATLASEDRHYLAHSGVNLYAIFRAFVQNLKNQRVVSGASTITQQVVRNVYHFRRNLVSKILEAWLAVRLERTMSKDEILVQYLNRISYGNQAFGIEAASQLYFDKSASDLSLAEAAFLSTLPRAPSELNPYRHFRAAEKRQKELLRRMKEMGLITVDRMDRALQEPLGLRTEKDKFRAPHFCDFILERVPPAERRAIAAIRTTLNFSLQEKVETLLKGHLDALEKKGITNGAVIVLDNRTGEILSMAGSRDFFDERHDGQVNGALALRQPGSTMKPLTYALALEKGMTAATILEDVPTQFLTLEGSFMPENYDERYHGPIRLRSALASSYNIPAVAVLQTLGPDLLYRRLKELGFSSLQKSPDFYGVGLTLGNGEVTLLELTRAYAALARGGSAIDDRSVIGMILKDGSERTPAGPAEPRPVYSPGAAYIITDILSDKDARVPTFGYNSPLNFPFAVAAKTGTSKDFRDNWTVGYTPRFTVGVWVGNFDGSPMHGVSGMTGAGPLFKDIMLLLSPGESGSFEEPRSLVHVRICPMSGELVSPRCPSAIDEIFLPGTAPKTACRLSHAKVKTAATAIMRDPGLPKDDVMIAFPRDGDVFKLDPVLRRDYQSIRFKAVISDRIEVRAVEWWVNGRPIGSADSPFAMAWNLVPGSYTIKARAVLRSGRLESRPVRITVIS